MQDKVIPPMHIGQMMGRVKHHTCAYHMRGLPLWLHAAARGFPVAVEGLSPAGQGHCLVWHSALPGATYNKQCTQLPYNMKVKCGCLSCK